MEAIAAAIWGFVGCVGEGKGQGAAPGWMGPGLADRGSLEAENTAGMLLSRSGAAAQEGLILAHLLQHDEVDNPPLVPAHLPVAPPAPRGHPRAQPRLQLRLSRSPQGSWPPKRPWAGLWGRYGQLALVWEETSGFY